MSVQTPRANARATIWGLLGLVTVLLGIGAALAAPKTMTYTYDALGRLTFVSDSQNGNRDYDYDKAGNRVLVTIGEATDEASEPGAPPAPKNLTTTLSQNCRWRADWTAVSVATSYKVRDTVGNEQTVYTNQAFVICPINNQNANKPKWVKACLSTGTCSVQATF